MRWQTSLQSNITQIQREGWFKIHIRVNVRHLVRTNSHVSISYISSIFSNPARFAYWYEIVVWVAGVWFNVLASRREFYVVSCRKIIYTISPSSYVSYGTIQSAAVVLRISPFFAFATHFASTFSKAKSYHGTGCVISNQHSSSFHKILGSLCKIKSAESCAEKLNQPSPNVSLSFLSSHVRAIRCVPPSKHETT